MRNVQSMICIFRLFDINAWAKFAQPKPWINHMSCFDLFIRNDTEETNIYGENACLYWIQWMNKLHLFHCWFVHIDSLLGEERSSSWINYCGHIWSEWNNIVFDPNTHTCNKLNGWQSQYYFRLVPFYRRKKLRFSMCSTELKVRHNLCWQLVESINAIDRMIAFENEQDTNGSVKTYTVSNIRH